MEHDTTSDETTDEMNAGCGGSGSGPYIPNNCIRAFEALRFGF